MMAGHSPFIFCPACGSRLEQKQVFGKQRPVCPACGRVHFIEPKVAVAVIITRANRLLLVQRGNEPAMGLWSLPGGFVDAGEDPREAARRECSEETGLDIHALRLLDVIHTRGDGDADLVIVYDGDVEHGTPRAGDDASQVVFFDQEKLPPLAFEATRKAVECWAGVN